ncbi:GNAT family N-acetyltransferase [Chryseobacterium sp. L7]|uniref:GNAT family N-acetyltransferase n=1 Tax=Chryseobacterium endalhagicum TaxID=2797638 RepID=A0ABS1QIT1_9FLAO|nr:GNAT family N-acetyltransferase [Chryseobacterium endalhagicum]MBL1222532.1 GNAT family N-acetyltransferase [Chryseobacterium endalhagicum]
MNINYRLLLPDESKNYRSIRLESLAKFPEAFCASYEESVKIEKFRLETDIENQAQDRFVLGAFADAELIGICSFVKDENNTGNIYQMYVKGEFQGKNIGFGLIQAVIDEARKRCNGISIFLEVTHNNEKAYHLYKKIGFSEVPDDSGEQENGSRKMYLNTTD